MLRERESKNISTFIQLSLSFSKNVRKLHINKGIHYTYKHYKENDTIQFCIITKRSITSHFHEHNINTSYHKAKELCYLYIEYKVYIEYRVLRSFITCIIVYTIIYYSVMLCLVLSSVLNVGTTYTIPNKQTVARTL